MTHPCHKELKRVAECAARLEKPTGNGKFMNTRQAMNSYGSGACTRFKHHPLVPSQYRGDGPWVRSKKGYGLAVGRREKSILGFLLRLFWGKCSAMMIYH